MGKCGLTKPIEFFNASLRFLLDFSKKSGEVQLKFMKNFSSISSRNNLNGEIKAEINEREIA